jgi:LysM repeat protein
MKRSQKKTRNIILKTFIGLLSVLFLAGLVFTTGTGTALAQEGGEVDYTIRPGDTMYEIAQSFDTTIENLVEANPDIRDPDYILAGEVLIIPSGDLPPRTAVLGPTNGPPGTVLRLRGEGYQPNREIQVLFGPENVDSVTAKQILADENGRLETELTVPPSAVPGSTWIALIRPADQPDEYLEQSNTFEVEQSEEQTPDTTQASIYLVDLEDQGVHGELIGCDDSLVPVSMPIDPDADPVRSALQNVFETGEIHDDSGLYNSLYQSDLTVERIEIDGGTAKLFLAGSLQLGGVCDEPRAKSQIIETVNQFPEVSDVIVFVNGEEVYTEEDQDKGADNQTYTIQPNDVLSHIAVSFRTTVAAIVRRNPEIEKPSLISVGQEISIPGTDDDNPYVQINLTNGKPGTAVTYQAENLLPHRTYTVGVGLINSEYNQVMEIVTDQAGSAQGQVAIPEEAAVDQYWVVVLDSSSAPDLKVVSNLFEVE